jgi:predicted permease
MHDWRADIRARLSSARLHPQDEAEIVEEVAQHLEQQFDELAPVIGAGPARERLLTQLRHQDFDDAATRRRRRARSTRTRTWSSTSVWRDVWYGLRSLRRSPGMLAAGTAALSLGIGLTTVMYSVIYDLLIKGLPFEHSARIAMIYHADPAREDEQIPFGSFVHYERQQRSFEAIGAYLLGPANVSGGDRPDRVDAARMSAGAFDVTGVRAMFGRTFTARDNEPGSPPTAILGYAMWRDRYQADSGAVGKQIRVNGRPYTIVGVMPEGFEFPVAIKVWLPLQTDPATLRPGEGPQLTVIGRLRPDVTYERANAEFAVLTHQLATDLPPGAAERRVVVEPFIRATVPTRVYSLLYAMLGAVFLVLLVACANVANLLLDRAAGRTREIGIRTALGASRLAVIRQSLVESSILAGLAAVVGTGIAQAGIVLFNRAMVDTEPPFWMDMRLHPPVLLFVLFLAVVASLASGLLPAIQSARLDISTILKDESHAASSRRVGRLSRTIVGIQIALSSAMLLAAGLMTKSIVKLRTIDPGFATADVYTARVSLTSRDTVRQRRFFETMERELAALRDVTGVYLGSELPGSGWSGDQVEVEGRVYTREQDRPSTRLLAVNPGFFSTFGIRMLRGRPIVAEDRQGSPHVAVVSESFARRHFAATDPIGRRVRLGGPDSEREWLTIVGVMPTLYAASMRDPWPAEVLTAFWQEERWLSASVAVRGFAGVAAAPIRKIVAALDSEVPVYAAASMDDVLARPMWFVHVFGTMFVIFGLASLILAAIGLYAVMALSVSRRVREMGIRMALGATAGDVIRMICRQGARQIVLGMSIGLVAGSAVVRLARAVLFDVQPDDPVVFAFVAVVLGAAALVACIIPAIGATRVDPVIALRTE